MDRRTLLAAAGAGLAGLSGCGSAGPSDEPTSTPATDTPAATATAASTETPEPTVTPPKRRYQPQLLDVALVSEWAAPGDLEANRVDAVRRGQPAVVAFRYRLRVPEGTINLKEGIDISNADGLVVRRNRERDRTVDSAGLYTWEDAVTLRTDDWPLGELTASVAIGELQLHRTSDQMSVSFELTSG
ncbi:hypothetical protein [Haloplanus salilacus]|uniref:hypothetical protein n=1 Tax=Haloplanus salilacus TaxID=2949994 RepID=UPI0030CE658E